MCATNPSELCQCLATSCRNHESYNAVQTRFITSVSLTALSVIHLCVFVLLSSLYLQLSLSLSLSLFV